MARGLKPLKRFQHLAGSVDTPLKRGVNESGASEVFASHVSLTPGFNRMEKKRRTKETVLTVS